MPVVRLIDLPVFPDPREADEEGLLAVGGDLSVPRLLAAYRRGIFPWYEDDLPILWWSPPERAVFLPGDGRLSHRAQRALRRIPFEIRWDTAFEAVIGHCQKVPRPGQEGTWITEAMREAYIRLHREGFAHSVEAWLEGELVGGLYGVSLGTAFFGESMFSLRDYGSRAAFSALLERLWAWGFQLLDGQLPNANLAQLGARVLDREAFLVRLEGAMAHPTRRGPWA